MNKTILITVGVIVLVVLGVSAYTWYQPKTAHDTGILTASSSDQNMAANQEAADQTTNTNTTQTAASKPPINSIILADLATGNMATVREVSLTRPGYVVLYVIDSNGVTRSIGHSDLLSVGLHTNVTIQTDTVVAYKQAVIAVVHQDNGDGTFTSPGVDPYLVNSNGSIVSDIDVVGVQGVSKEAAALQLRVGTYLENLNKTQASTSATSQ